MKLETTSLTPKLGTFIKFFVFTLIVLFALRTCVQIFIFPSLAQLKTYTTWANLALLALGTAVGVTWGGKRVQIVLENLADTEKAKDWSLAFLSKNGLQVRAQNANEVKMESKKSFNRVFNHWFGTELVSISQQENKIVIEGPFRHVENLDSKLRFGKDLGF